ncbi:PA0069 family radical SAM protein [Erythrobacteraceae bacterium CFH 75059]|uniref:PA0069 family radical SAM protein n=1 Tax=Qipengyuania thermophila TaxID=2509361 RepID=UPI00101EC23E|nr:PA0069 family radical SAM protein [Qipengyuania thermophila]TCD05327.1 PA0069 family radical SAM protein [Erythrobacteraceae bacterium CFH 75059]
MERSVHRIKGRGAQSGGLSTRFAELQRVADEVCEGSHASPAEQDRRTQVEVEHARAVLTRNASPDIGFDRSVNPYRGCEHGCIYCYARPTHAYLGLSPGLDFERRITVKSNAATVLRQTFASPSYRPAPLALGTSTDGYQPVEATWRVTRAILELCLECRHPVTVTTKSDRVLKDLDLLARLAAQRLVSVAVSVTSLDPALSRRLEPRAASPARRIAAMRELAAAGIPVHCAVSPVIPALTDMHLEAIVAEAARAGVVSAGWIPLRLPLEVAPLFKEWLDTFYPDRASKVMGIVRSMRNGQENDPRFFERFRGSGPWAELLQARFAVACRRANLGRQRITLDTNAFRRPPDTDQLQLL